MVATAGAEVGWKMVEMGLVVLVTAAREVAGWEGGVPERVVAGSVVLDSVVGAPGEVALG